MLYQVKKSRKFDTLVLRINYQYCLPIISVFFSLSLAELLSLLKRSVSRTVAKSSVWHHLETRIAGNNAAMWQKKKRKWFNNFQLFLYTLCRLECLSYRTYINSCLHAVTTSGLRNFKCYSQKFYWTFCNINYPFWSFGTFKLHLLPNVEVKPFFLLSH